MCVVIVLAERKVVEWHMAAGGMRLAAADTRVVVAVASGDPTID
jgi:hypothetical protein